MLTTHGMDDYTLGLCLLYMELLMTHSDFADCICTDLWHVGTSLMGHGLSKYGLDLCRLYLEWLMTPYDFAD